MPTQACLSPRSGVRRRKDSSERAVWLSGRPLRPARIRPNPPNPGANGPVPEQNRSPERRRGRPEAFAPTSILSPPGRPSNTAPKVPSLDEDPPPTPKLQTRNPTPAPLWTSALLQGDRNPPESVIGLPERVIGIVGMRMR